LAPTEELSHLRKLYELSMTLSGDPMEIFPPVARMIGELLDVKVVCLSEIRGSELHFLSVYVQGELFVNAGSCPLEITPCATVEASKDIRIYDRVMDRFPQATFLKEHNAYSYCGFPSLDNNGNVVAVTCLLDDRPHEFTTADQEILRIFGQRIGLEIERKHLVDEREAALSSLKENEQRFRDVAGSTGQFIWELDADGRFIYVAEPVLGAFGHSASELLGRTPFDFLFPEDISWISDYFINVVKRNPSFHGLEHRVLTHTGEVNWVQVSGVRVVDEQGEVRGFRGTTSNITGRKLTEEKLERERNHLRLILDNLFTYVAVMEPDGTVTEVNRALLQSMGIKKEDFLGTPFADAVSWSHQPELKTRLQSAIQRAGQGAFVRFDVPLHPADSIDFCVGPILDAQGLVTELVACGTDISERKMAEQTLRESEERLRLIAESITEVFWMTDLSVQEMFYVSPSYERVWKRSRKDLYENPRSLVDAVHPDDREDVQAGFALQQIGQPFDCEYRITWPDGSIRWIWNRGFPIRDETGIATRCVGVAQDITERKQAENSRHESEQRLELALMGADLGLWDWNMETGTVFYSDRWATMLGYARDDIPPVYDGWARLVHPEDMARVRKVLEAHLEGRTPHYEVEHRLLTKTGEWKWVLSMGKVFERDPRGAPLRASGTHMDISGRKALEERLRLQNDQLCHAQRLTLAGELTATMAHELNQPLGAIGNYVGAAILKFSDLVAAHPELQEMLHEISRLSLRAAEVVRGIRKMVRTQELRQEWVDLKTSVDEIFPLVSSELTRRQIQFVVDIPSTLPRIWAGRVQLQQLLLNLILNAMDAMHTPELTHRQLTLRAELNRQHEIDLSIGDTGPGIAPDIVRRLFEPFVSTKPDGIGLGLSICRTIVEAHGGHIAAHSVPGEGTTFNVVLPASKGSKRRVD